MDGWKGFVIVVLLTLAGCAVPAPAPPTTAPAGGLEGVISDASTGEPIPNAQVTIAGQAGVFTVATGADGKYKVASLVAGAYLVSAQATGYYVNTAQVGIAANVTSAGNVALEPAIAAAAATPAPALTPLPTPPVPTPIIITVVVTSEPAPTASPTPRPAGSAVIPRPAVAYAAPTLLDPRDRSAFYGPQRIIFRWTGPCCLAADEYFVVSIPHPQGVEEAWVKGTAWQAPDYLYLLVPPSRELTWNVSVRRRTGQYPNGQWKGPIVSALSETWRFKWYPGSETSPLAPISPLPTP